MSKAIYTDNKLRKCGESEETRLSHNKAIFHLGQCSKCYSGKIIEEPTETEERRFTIKDMQDAIRFGADRGNTFCGFPSELNDYLTDEWKQYFKEKFNIDITRKIK